MRIKPKYIPLVLAFGIIITDQITKALIVHFIPVDTIGRSFWNGFLRIIHTRNFGIAFSIGYSWPRPLQFLVFSILPLGLLAALLVYFFRMSELSKLQRWAVAGIIGGGFGNIVDRFFRTDGVVDFIDVNIRIIRGNRWPAFNVADSAVVVSAIFLLLCILIEDRRKKGE